MDPQEPDHLLEDLEHRCRRLGQRLGCLEHALGRDPQERRIGRLGFRRLDQVAGVQRRLLARWGGAWTARLRTRFAGCPITCDRLIDTGAQALIRT